MTRLSLLAPKAPLRQLHALDLFLTEYQETRQVALLPQAEAACLVILDRIREEQIRQAPTPPVSKL
jgi:hypothetical protein